MPKDNSNFVILDARREDEKARWLLLWQESGAREVYTNPYYGMLFNTETDVAYCAIWQNCETTILYPFILRAIRTERAAEQYFDITTPYGYGGASYSGKKSVEVENLFWEKFDQWSTKQRIVCEFVRFSLFADNLIHYPGLIEENNLNIVCDLHKDEESRWMQFKHKVRKNVNRARESGLKVNIDTTGETLDSFLRIYYDTMERNKAESKYYFPREFFSNIISNLRGNFVIVNVFYKQLIISTELILVSAKSMYSFLGGTLADYYEMRPNDLLKYESILWGKNQGLTYYVLGGGYKRDDGIYKYKQAFAPDGEYVFKVGKRILNQKIYDELCQKMIEQRNGDFAADSFFPLYRAPH